MEQHTEVPDRTLAERVITQGDEMAFRTLFRRHSPALRQFVLRLAGGNEDDADDVVQEAWLAATRALGRFRWESSLRTWLRAIALNVWRNRARKREPEWLLLDERQLPDPTPAEPGHGIDLERALALLPPGYRTVLLLHDREGLTHEEIGSALGISAGTSKSQLSNARARMRAVLAPGGYSQ